MEDKLIYLIIWFLSVYLSLLSDIHKDVLLSRFYLIISFMILTFFLAFRGPDTGADTESYLKVYDRMVSRSFSLEDLRYEPGFVFMGYIAYNVFNASSFEFQYIVSIITMIFLYISLINIGKPYSIFIIIFLGLSIYFNMFNGSRTLLAISIATYSLRYIFYKKPYKYIITIIISSLFHFSTIFLLLLLITFKNKISKTFIITIYAFTLSVIISPVVLVDFISILIGYVNIIQYFPVYTYEIDLESIRFNIRQVVYLVLLTYMVIYYIINYEKIYTDNKYYRSIIIIIISLSFTLLMSPYNVLYRISLGFQLFAIFISVYLIKNIKTTYNSKLILYIALMSISFLMYYRSTLSNSNGILPYTNKLFNFIP